MIFFVDFEASSLLPGSFPIEVAWVNQDGKGESYLIRPEPAWMTVPGAWSYQSAAVHGISLDQLMAEGLPAQDVATRALEALGAMDAVAYSDAPAFDNPWLGRLLDVIAPGTRNQVALRGVRELYGAAYKRLSSLIPTQADWAQRQDGRRRVDRLIEEIAARVEEAEAMRFRVCHRALPDAESLWRTWCAVRDEVDLALGEGP